MKKIKTLTKIIYAISLSLLIILVVLGVIQLLKVKVIQTTARPVDMEGFPALGGKYIFNVSDNEIKNYFYKNPQIKDVYIRKKYPNILLIDVIYRTRIAQIISANGIFVLDSEGIVFEKDSTNSALPIIDLPNKKISLGTNITQNNLQVALKILNLAKDNYLHIVSIIPQDDQTVLLTLDSGTQIIVGSNGNAEDIVSSLQMIVRRFTIEGKTVSKIDFRFERPVITF